MAPSHAPTAVRTWAKRWTGARAGGAIEPRNQEFGVPTPCQWAEGNTVGGASASRQRAPRGRRTFSMTQLPNPSRKARGVTILRPGTATASKCLSRVINASASLSSARATR